MLEPSLAETIERDHDALDALVTGDPEPKKRLFSTRDDVTLANPLVGVPVPGRREVERTLDDVAGLFRDGLPHEFERIAAYAAGDLAYVFEVERSRARMRGSPELQPFSLRATTVWRREEDGWKIAHRHADPITAPRPPESIVDR